MIHSKHFIIKQFAECKRYSENTNISITVSRNSNENVYSIFFVTQFPKI